MERVFLHIGLPKTGTSVIQSHLAQNRAALRDTGFLYPITISSNKALYRTYESHHLLTYSLADWKPFNLYSPDLFFQMAEVTAKKHGLHTLLLSAENTFWLPRQIVAKELPERHVFWREKREYVKNIYKYLGQYESEIIIYLRRQDRWIESWFNQQVKNGNALLSTMNDFIEHHRWLLDYETLLSIWAEIFGHERIRVRVYEKEQLPDGLFADFCRVVGIDEPGSLPLRKKARYNAQLERDALEFLNICNRLTMSPRQRLWLRLAVRKVTNQFESRLIFHKQSLLTPSQRFSLVKEYADMNERIAKSYFGRNDGRLFVEPMPDPDAAWEPYPGLRVDTAVRILMQLLLELQQEHNRGWSVGGRALQRLTDSLSKTRPVFDPLAAAYRRAADQRYWNAHIWDHK